MKETRKPNGGFVLAEAPSHLIKRCQQYFGDLYARETGTGELTKQQFTVLAALETNEGASQTALVGLTGIDRSTLAEMVRRLLERGLLSRARTEADARANAIAITTAGRKALRSARTAAERAEKALLYPLAPSERARFVKSLALIAAAGDAVAASGEANVPDKRKRRRGK
jgi:DNA-binding MarR family transcriptional regulator